MDWFHRIVSGQAIAPTELRIAGLFVLEWWLMDHIWFVGTVRGWW